MIKKIIYFLPSVVIMFTIFYLSSGRTGIQGTPTGQFLIHKNLHILVYACLSASYYFALNKSGQKFIKKTIPASIIFTYIYGVSDEIHQYFVPGRGAKFTDTLFDLLGAFIGVYLLKLIYNYQPGSHPKRQ